MSTELLSRQGFEPRSLETLLGSFDGSFTGSRSEEEAPAIRQLAMAALTMLKDTQTALSDAKAQLETQRQRINVLETLSHTDELTTLANRRGFNDVFVRELDRVKRAQSKGGLLLMIDLDNFKGINDTYGHDAGDAALQLVAATLTATVRRMDTAARLGGDEFVVLFANADTAQAASRAQQLSVRLNSLYLRYKGERIPLRASIGMKSYKAGDTVEDIFVAADKTMYAAKSARKATA